MPGAANETTPLSEEGGAGGGGAYSLFGGSSPSPFASFLPLPLPRLGREESLREIRRAACWAALAGSVNLLAGIFALTYPAWTSALVLWWLALLLVVVGSLHVLGLCYAEPGRRWSTFWLGTLQVAVALLAFFYPLESLVSLTVTIAAGYMLSGTYLVALACCNGDALAATGTYWTVVLDGTCNVLMSAVILAAMPLSALYTVGVLLGCNMAVGGVSRIAAACAARAAASGAIEREGEAAAAAGAGTLA